MFHKLAISRQLSVVRQQRGFALVSAIFILVILAALGGFVVTVSTTQSASQGLDIQGSRAYQAARAGIEWGAYQVLASPPSCQPNTNVALGGTLTDFALTVSCTALPTPPALPYVEGANNVVVYQLISTATFAAIGSPDYVERRIESTISICTDPLDVRC